MGTRVLYIAGAGRSGTTFLSMLLSQNDDAQNIGQIRDLPMAMEKQAPCSCRRSVPDCNFWGPVRAQLEARHGAEAMVALKTGKAAFRKAANAEASWQDPAARARLAQAHAAHLERLKTLYDAAAERAGGRMLVDSSKSVDVALALSLIPEIDVHVLNLLRDPRAVAVSWAKIIKKEDRLRMRTRNWVERQQRAQWLGDHDSEKFMSLRYEDLTVAPRQYVQKIQSWAGLESTTPFFTDDHSARISWAREHLFPPANASVLRQRKTEISIRTADSWTDPKNADLHAMAEELTFPFAETYGYQRGVTAASASR